MTDPVVSLAALKDELRITHNVQDAMLTRKLHAACDLVERDTWLTLRPITRTIARRSFPMGGESIVLPGPPLRSVLEVAYLDVDGNSQTVDEFRADTLHFPGAIEPAAGKSWPVNQPGPLGVTVTFEAGYLDPADIPETLQAAILLIAAESYRDEAPVEIKPRSTLDRLLEKHRVRDWGILESVWSPQPVSPKWPQGIFTWFTPISPR